MLEVEQAGVEKSSSEELVLLYEVHAEQEDGLHDDVVLEVDV